METYNQFRDLQKSLNLSTDQLAIQIRDYEAQNRALLGWDVMISTKQWKDLKSSFNKQFKELQEINKVGVKKFKKEINQYYQDKKKGLQV